MFPVDTNQLREILDHIKRPEMLDNHPWALARFARDIVNAKPGLSGASPGVRLVEAIGDIFAGMLPAMPPKKGKRLDSRWGEFGILAALYFAPLRFGDPAPDSFRDAWGRIDNAILKFVYESATTAGADYEKYKLVGAEPEVAPSSTLSDWHRKGLQRLAAEIQARETYLMNRNSLQELSKPALEEGGGHAPSLDSGTPKRRPIVRYIALVTVLSVLIGIAVVAYSKVARIYSLALAIKEDVAALQGLAASPSLDAIRESEAHLKDLRENFDLLQEESEGYLWLPPLLGWVPIHGGDLASIPDLIELTDALLASVERSHSVVLTLIDTSTMTEGDWDIPLFFHQLYLAGPEFKLAQSDLERAQLARMRLDPARLSPPLRDLLLSDIDRALALMEDGLTLALELPNAAGFSSEGPQTYLLLAQNEDELRPTGGFITAAGTLLVKDGKVMSLSFQNSSEFDNWEWPYPPAPRPLELYMNSPVLIFRDANWYTDFPTSVQYIEYIYSYTNSHSVDGVIAFDQQFLVDVLRVTGPLKIEGEEDLIGPNNVVNFMRLEKTPSAEDLKSGEWNNKAFINKITVALLDKVKGNEIPPRELFGTVVQALNQGHLLLQLDNPPIADLLARRNWDGALRAGEGDFLMVVDSNVGFNKTNAVVEAGFSYDVDLTNPDFPEARLVVTHRNQASDLVPCLPYPYLVSAGIPDELLQKNYPIDRCYWNYLRIYTLIDAQLLGAETQEIPAEWTVLGQSVSQQVDEVDEELDGLRGWGVLEVVPGGESVALGFHFALPPQVIKTDGQSGQSVYRLNLQKQPGTREFPVNLRVHLPPSATLISAPSAAQIQGSNVLFQFSLAQDVELEIVFVLP